MLSHGSGKLPPIQPHRSPVMLQDLLDDLLWPKLLRSWKLALAPGRVALCFFFLVSTVLLALLYHALKDGKPLSEFAQSSTGHFHAVVNSITTPKAAALSLYALFIEGPLDFVKSNPIAFFVIIPVILTLWCATGGAVCRSAACEVSLRAALPWRTAIGFGLRKTPALFAAIAGPVILIWAGAFALKLLGWVFFTSKFMGLFGSAFFILPLLFAFIIGAAALAYLIVQPLLIPAVACEGTDSFDAVQRCYAYILARPGRLIGYTLIAIASSLPAILVAILLVTFAVVMAGTLTSAPLEAVAPVTGASPEDHWKLSRLLSHFWFMVLVGIAFSYFLSLYFCAATNIYLVVRRLVDGQDIDELWTPATTPEAQFPSTTPPTPPPIITEKADYT